MAMIARLIRLASLVASAIVIVSFGLFAVEQANAASDGQRAKLEVYQRPAPATPGELKRQTEHGQARELVDDANDFLVTPFVLLVGGRNIWIQRVGTTLLALLVYGVALTVGANYLRK